MFGMHSLIRYYFRLISDSSNAVELCKSGITFALDALAKLDSISGYQLASESAQDSGHYRSQTLHIADGG